MVLNYKKSQSSVYPELVDTTSSKKYVYLRQNIVEVELANEATGETYTHYEYEEAKLTKEEYAEYLKELEVSDVQQQRMDITTLQEENQMLNEQISILTECLLEMSAMVYA